jgi:protein O-GlcNAc transferase
MTHSNQITAQHIQSWAQQALALQKAGQYLEASQAYMAILQHAPNHWPSCYNLGLVFQALDRDEDALTAYQRAIAGNPKLGQAYNNLGNVLTKVGRREEAETAYRKALEINPELSEARYNVALIEQSRGKFSASVESLCKVVAINSAHDDAWDALYRALLGLKRNEEAIDAFVKWEAAVGESASLAAAGLALSRSMGDVARERKYVELAVRWPFASSSPQQLVPILGMIQYYDVTGDELLCCYRRYNDVVAAQNLACVPQLPLRAAGPRVRVGYVSADFRRHVMGRIMMEIIGGHDRSQFEIVLVSLCDKPYQDEVTAEFKRISDAFIDVAALSDFDAAKAIGEADLDVLVDLAGHTMGARPSIYAHRPARHIVTHLGYHGCLGLDAIDYKITDHVADTEKASLYQIEKPYFLDACLFPFLHLPSTTEDEQRSLSKLEPLDLKEHFVFATFVNLLKLSPRCLSAWRRILEAVPQAVLAFSPLGSGDEPGIRRVMQAAGIDGSRLRFIPAGTNDSEQRARYLLVDAVLDTFPYAGGDTTLAALDRDVPVVTLCGQRNAERVGVSILTHLGVTDTVCYGIDEYVACAVRIASDGAWHSSLIARIAQARKDTALTSVANHTRALEKAFRDIAKVERYEVSAMAAREFFPRFQAALRRHQSARGDIEFDAVAQEYDLLASAQPRYLPLLQARSALAQARGRMDDALLHLKVANKEAPGEPNVAASLAALLIDHGAVEEAVAVVDAALERPNALPLLHLHKAQALLKLGKPDQSVSAIAPYVDRFPNAIDGLLVQANALAELHQADDALNTYRRVLSIDSRNLVANYNAAVLWLERGEYVLAESLLRRVIEQNGTHERAFAQLAALLKTQGKTDAYVGIAKVFLSQNPSSLRARLVRAESYRYEGQLAREQAELGELAKLVIASTDHDLVEAVALDILKRAHVIALDEVTSAQLALRYELALEAFYGRQNTVIHKRDPVRALRLCVLADGAQTHLRTTALIAWLANLQREESAVTICLIGKAGKGWLSVMSAGPFPVKQFGGFVPEAVGDALRDEAFDVLIDCCGLRQPNVPPILVQRTVPLQVVNPAFALPYRGRAIDFELFDEFSALPDWASRGPEHPMLQVPALVGPVQTRAGANVMRSPANESGRKPVYAVIASVEELSVEVLAWWRAILDELPAAQLCVAPDSDNELRNYQRIFQSAGIGASRITSRGATAQVDGSLSLQGVDALLDMSTSSDAVVAAEALSLGCPVVAMRGGRASERMAYAVLARMGLTDFVADSGRDYVELATKKITDGTFAAAVREKILMPNAAAPVLRSSLVNALRAALEQPRS